MAGDSSRTVLITGATGTVGRRLAGELSKDHASGRLRVLGAARNEKGSTALRTLGVEPVAFDFDDPSSIQAAVAGVDGLFLLTGYTVDMLSHCKLTLDAARAAGVRQVVHLGAMAPQDPDLSILVWHEMVERYVEWAGFDFTHLRPNFFMQTLVSGARRAKGRLFHFIGDVPVSWIDAEDVAAVAAAALRDPASHAGKTYQLASEVLTVREVAETLTEIVGVPFTYVARPIEEFLPILLKNGMEPAYAAGLAENTARIANKQNPVADAVFDNIEAITGRPATTWRHFAEKNRSTLTY
ncbi:MAG: NmrA family NAD(P)-binding protein [Alphaproteobacteria bacterium]|nr:NmrA family NAD(P)-binding protein [Hyphomicrobiales bacterium]MDH3233549.1 NmrA family NAD(P)-binding protein [Alphaproteobacteria bacterium]